MLAVEVSNLTLSAVRRVTYNYKKVQEQGPLFAKESIEDRYEV